jgi:hypothetical protein
MAESDTNRWYIIAPDGEPVSSFTVDEWDAFEKRAKEVMFRAHRLRAVPVKVAEEFGLLGQRRSMFEHLADLLDGMEALCERAEAST